MRVFWFMLLSCLSSQSAWATWAYVLNSNDNDYSIIDMDTYEEVRRVPVGKGPHHLVLTPDKKYLVVGNATSNELVLVDPESGDIVKRIKKIADPYHLAFSPDGKWFVANGNRLDRVDVYRYNDGEFTLAKRVPLPKRPSHMAYTANSQQVFITLQDSNEVAAITLADQSVAWTVEVGPLPAGIWLTPDQKYLLVAHTGGDDLDILSAKDGSFVKKLRTDKGAHNFTAVGDGKHLLLSNRVAGNISVIDYHQLKEVERFKVPGGPDDMELTNDGKELWVTTRWINRVTVVDWQTRKIKQRIKVGRSPHGLFFRHHAARQ